jgi:DNA repair protein RadC
MEQHIMHTHQQTAIWQAPPTRPRGLAERPLCEWPIQERPIERLAATGAGSLSDTELLALILGSCGKTNPIALAGELIAHAGGWHGLLKCTTEELAAMPGMSRAKAASIKAALEIARRLILTNPEDRLQIRSPTDAATLLMAEMAHLDQEHLRTIILDTKNRVVKVHTIYIGSLNSSIVRVGEVFKEALRLNAAAIIVVHNHPSGDPTPSPEDVLVTRQIVEAGQLLEIEVLDHLVIGHAKFVSMRERHLGFAR